MGKTYITSAIQAIVWIDWWLVNGILWRGWWWHKRARWWWCKRVRWWCLTRRWCIRLWNTWLAIRSKSVYQFLYTVNTASWLYARYICFVLWWQFGLINALPNAFVWEWETIARATIGICLALYDVGKIKWEKQKYISK